MGVLLALAAAWYGTVARYGRLVDWDVLRGRAW